MQDSVVLHQVILTIHLVGLALGLGGAFTADYSFFRSVRQADRISPETVTWMRSFSRMVWAGLVLLSISGLGLFLLKPDLYIHSSGFMFKMFLVIVLVVNGLLLNFYSTARLTTFNFSQKYKMHDAAWKVRKLSFIFGSVSSTTWFSIIVTSMFKGVVDISFVNYLLLYLIILSLAICASLLLESILFVRASTHPPTEDLNNMPLNHLASFSSHIYKKQINNAKANTLEQTKDVIK